MDTKMETARKALKHWIHAIKTGDWEGYMELLTEDYTFWLPKGGFTYKTSDLVSSKEQLVDSDLNVNRLRAYSNEPSRVSRGENTVVFEFIYDADDSNSYFQNCMALSFDVEGEMIKACREYHCVLMKF